MISWPSSSWRKGAGSHVASGYRFHLTRYCKPIRFLLWSKTSLPPEKTGEKRFIEQDVSPSRASSAKQRIGWGGKELHTGTEKTRHRCPGARYGKTGKGGSRRSEGIRLTHAHGEGGGVTYRYRGISAPVPGPVKLARGEVEEMKRSSSSS